MNSTVKTSGCFSKSRGLRASVPFFPLPHPLSSTFLFLSHFSRGPNDSFARPEFRSGTLATQATFKKKWPSLLQQRYKRARYCVTGKHESYLFHSFLLFLSCNSEDIYYKTKDYHGKKVNPPYRPSTQGNPS